MNGIYALFSAFGLSTAAGLNAYIPLLMIGVLARYAPNLIHLNAPYDILTNPWLLIGIGVIAIVDFIGDKIPAVDHALHAAGLLIHPAAGAIVFLAANSEAGAVNPVLAALCGLLVAGGAHGLRATARPVATATTAGIGNPVLSLIEDVTSFVLSLLAVVLPVIAFMFVVAFVLVSVVAARRIWRWRSGATR